MILKQIQYNLKIFSAFSLNIKSQPHYTFKNKKQLRNLFQVAKNISFSNN